jgi:hypothetical protein
LTNQVIDWTFERIDLRVVGMEWAQGRLDAQEADDNIIPLQVTQFTPPTTGPSIKNFLDCATSREP